LRISFSFIFQTNPPVLTLVSCVILAFVLIDLLVPMAVRALFKNENWFVCFFKLEMQNNSIWIAGHRQKKRDSHESANESLISKSISNNYANQH